MARASGEWTERAPVRDITLAAVKGVAEWLREDATADAIARQTGVDRADVRQVLAAAAGELAGAQASTAFSETAG